jgi:hypothetical protein
MQAVVVADVDKESWWLGDKAGLAVPTLADPSLQQWLGKENVEAVAKFCQERMDAFYRQAAAVQGEQGKTHFAEKYVLNSDHFVPVTLNELYPQAREIILVRDFRDMLCSILAFNAKRGYTAFGRQRVADEVEYVQRLRLDALGLLQSWKNRSKRAHLVRYEDLIGRPEETVSGIFRYIGIDVGAATVKRVIEQALEDTAEMKEHRTASDASASVGRWERELNDALKIACHEAFAEALTEFGYRR